MGMGEAAATKSLTWLASDPRLRKALLAHIGARAGVDLGAVDRLIPESVHDDRSRPDIEMLDVDGHTMAVVEAKFSALLTDAQVNAYLNILERRSGPHRGALFVLVPPSRVNEAQRTIDRVIRERGPSAALAVVTWDEWIDLWNGVADSAQDDWLISDVQQLKSMCQTLGGLVIPPLYDTASGHGWQERTEDLVAIVRVLTAQLLGSLTPRDLPMRGDLKAKPYTYRYLPSISQDTWVQVGVWTRFANEGLTPFWVMLHRDDKGTGGFDAALQRLMSSRLAGQVRRDDRHAWIPLHPPPDATGPELVEALSAQVESVLEILRP